MLPPALEVTHAGQGIAGVTLLVAAGYELTPLKDVCLGKCRSPLGTLLGAATYGTAIVLIVLPVIMLAAPEALPGLTVPGQSPMPSMSPMGPARTTPGWQRH